ncbi:hypothetical protein ACKUB1_17890 [Methanospirillum stamsii]|uniref:hypothetical protein n=1 Tax=Methanospirillum stamsii TaxID=1277351 RepID=UPI0011B297A3|nr:hypothetical protein [Methanospirillum stamsii]
MKSDELSPIDTFIKSRKSETTKKYSRLILQTLSDLKTTDNQGLIRSRDLQNKLVSSDKIPNSSTFFKLLNDLESAGLINKIVGKHQIKQKGRPPVYYQARFTVDELRFISKEELLGKYMALTESALLNKYITQILWKILIGEHSISELSLIITKHQDDFLNKIKNTPQNTFSFIDDDISRGIIENSINEKIIRKKDRYLQAFSIILKSIANFKTK